MKVLVVGRTGVAGQATVADRACWGVLVIGMKTDVAVSSAMYSTTCEEACRAIKWCFIWPLYPKNMDPNLNFFKSMFGDP